jgi:hypothetical protein
MVDITTRATSLLICCQATLICEEGRFVTFDPRSDRTRWMRGTGLRKPLRTHPAWVTGIREAALIRNESQLCRTLIVAPLLQAFLSIRRCSISR